CDRRHGGLRRRRDRQRDRAAAGCRRAAAAAEDLAQPVGAPETIEHRNGDADEDEQDQIDDETPHAPARRLAERLDFGIDDLLTAAALPVALALAHDPA